MFAVIAREFVYSNYIEAGLWIALGIGAAFQAVRYAGAVRRVRLRRVILAISPGEARRERRG